MSAIKVKLSDSGSNTPGFHDYEYEFPEHNRGANADTFTLTIDNLHGNLMSVSLFDDRNREIANCDQSVGKIVITVHGALEHSDFMNMLTLIQESHDVASRIG